MELSTDKAVYEEFWAKRYRDIYIKPMRGVMFLRMGGILLLAFGMLFNKFGEQTENNHTFTIVIGCLGAVNLVLAIIRRGSIRKFNGALQRQKDAHLKALNDVESISLNETKSKLTYSVKQKGQSASNIYLTKDNIEHVNKFKDALVLETKSGTVILPKAAFDAEQNFEEIKSVLA